MKTGRRQRQLAAREHNSRVVFTCLLLGLLLFVAGCGPSEQTARAVTVESVQTLSPTPTSVALVPQPTLTAASATEPAPAESLEPLLTPTLDAGEDDLSVYYGGLVINMDYVGQTLTLRPNQGFLLRLGDEFNWTVYLSPEDVITANRRVTLEPADQGVFIARKRGFVKLTAVGNPVCLQAEPPCARPSVLYTLFVLVE